MFREKKLNDGGEKKGQGLLLTHVERLHRVVVSVGCLFVDTVNADHKDVERQQQDAEKADGERDPISPHLVLRVYC